MSVHRHRAAALLAVLFAVAGSVVVPAPPASAAPKTAADYQKRYFDILNIPEAHKITKGAGQIVGLVDDGVDDTRPGLKGVLVPGQSFAESTPNAAQSGAVHGTQMASLIAGRGGADDAVLGIAPEAKVMPISIGVPITASAYRKGIRYAADHGITILNLSLGGDSDPKSGDIEAIRYAISKGVIPVVAMGNVDGFNVINSLARIPGVLVVTGTDEKDRSWSGSVTGPQAVVSAPGANVLVACPLIECPRGLAFGRGTSASTAIVSGILALIRAKYPDLDNAGVINRLIKTSKDLGKKGRDEQYGYGRVDALAALTADVPPPAGNPLGDAADPSPSTALAAPRTEPKSSFLTSPAGVLTIAGAFIAVVVLAVAILLIARRGRGRPAPAAAAYGPQFPQQQPQQWQQAPPWRAAPQQWQPPPQSGYPQSGYPQPGHPQTGQPPPPWQQSGPGPGQYPPQH